jgi:nitrogen fixation/metabolism regulation signal transduction histidine kinase
LSRLRFERRLSLVALAAGAPGVVVSLVFLARYAKDGVAGYEALSVAVVVVGAWLALAWLVHARAESTMGTVANLVEALRARDFSIRAAAGKHDGGLREVYVELNALAESLRDRRLEAAEASALLQTVLAQVDVALFAFDEDHQLTLVNAAGERLLGVGVEEALGRRADDLGAGGWLDGPVPRVLEAAEVPGAASGEQHASRWELRRASFRRRGLPEQLVVLTDVGRALRVEERLAWQRLVRVLSHEVNNSLAPIQSIASTLGRTLARDTRSDAWEEDLRTGLDVVERRAASLARFLSAYATLARLPPPELRTVDVPEWIGRVAKLEPRATLQVIGGPACTLPADPDQLDAMLLNLVKNAAEASAATHGGVRIRWALAPRDLVLEVEDDGEGIADGANLFVPFFTTKPQGSGIGLVLSRQIAEAHQGELVLMNRRDARGCIARVRLPRMASSG